MKPTSSVRGMLVLINIILQWCFIFGLEEETSSKYVTTTSIHRSSTPMITADAKLCPFILITPSSNTIYFGKTARFEVTLESKVHPVLQARWQKLQTILIKNMNISQSKYNQTKLLHSPKLVINDANFEDEGKYRLQVRIAEGWCASNWVRLRVRGILLYKDQCNHTKECDPTRYLRCSSVYNQCLCDYNHYQRNQSCFSRFNLRAQITDSNITKNAIYVKWRNTYTDPELVQSYGVELRDAQSSVLMTNTSVGNQTVFVKQSDFVPGAMYYFTIISTVLLSDPVESIYVRSQKSFIVEPLPPGAINRTISNFHPEKMYLTWAIPLNNTRVDRYRLTVERNSKCTDSNKITWPYRLEPGKNYTISFVSISCYDYYCYRKEESVLYEEQIQTLSTPTLRITSEEYPTVPYLSTLVITAVTLNFTGFPQTTEIKWQKIRRYGTTEDIDTTEERYSGSILDLFNPVLIINKVDFDLDDDFSYKGFALNSDGWGSSLNAVNVSVIGSLGFLEACNRTRECIPYKALACHSNKCLCSFSYYHKNSTCHNRNGLRAKSIQVESSTCNITIKWEPPSQDTHLISGYEILWKEFSLGSWLSPQNASVGSHQLSYTTPCKLRPGRLYRIHIRTEVQLRNPTQTIYVEAQSSGFEVILEPDVPGPLSTMCNFSADALYLRWNISDKNSFVNRYKVTIEDHEQMTEGDVPEIFWEKLLEPHTEYNITITAISYGYTTNYPLKGKRKSLQSVYRIKTTNSKFDVNALLPYGNEDFILTGNDKTSAPLLSPTTVYVGDGSEGGFNNVTIGTNGIIGLGQRFNSPNVQDLKKLKDRQILCPYWTPLSSGNVYYKDYIRGGEQNSNSEFMEKADSIVKKYFKDFKNFKSSWLVKVTWSNMTLRRYRFPERKVTFQCLLITDGENTFTVMNYVDVNLYDFDVNLKPQSDPDISIGFRYKKFYKENMLSKTKSSFRMSKHRGNRGDLGVWIYKMTKGVRSLKDENECYLWYNFNKGLQLSSIECPCDNKLLNFDPRYAINRVYIKNQARLLCYASMTTGRNVECCYEMYTDAEHLGPLIRSKPLAGTVLQHNPFLQRQKYKNFDLKPKQQCCRTGHCDWYYEVRLIPDCYIRSPFQFGINYGDPHITTLDGKDYTFNGYGEYIMIKTIKNPKPFELQARTELAIAANGTTVNATIFSAFVAQDETGDKFQVEMSRDRQNMIIRANEKDLTIKFKNTSYSFLTSSLSIRWEEDKISASFLQSSITLKVSLGKGFLVCETLVSKNYKGMTLGLMGNFDGIGANDFILPNGTELSESSVKTERDIYYNFGQQWLVNESSIFHYDEGLTFKDFLHLDFVPLFTDEMDEDRLNEARIKCGPSPTSACIADYLATGDVNLALSSGNREKNSKKDIATLENESPQISGNTTINVRINKEVIFRFNISDDSKQPPVYRLWKQPADFHFDNQTGVAKWTPRNAEVSEISIFAEDCFGVQSPRLDVSINLCTGCNENGMCDFNKTLPTVNDHFHRAACVCYAGYSGENCEQDSDGCLEKPCTLNRDCIDLTPKEEVRLGRGYNCTECPVGFMESENDCTDIDECSKTSTCNASIETCVNTDGSFVCSCKDGYRKTGNNCKDIDECVELTSGCEQKCENTPGSFICKCHFGFDLNIDNTSCNKSAHDPCTNFDKKCEYSCGKISGSLHCICPLGYELASNDINCNDINECELSTTACEQDCINTKGSFNCTCRPGYFLNEDKTSCSECDLPNYGENCDQVCECGQGGDSCDPVSGCVCLSGWTGVKCDEDINECSVDPFICGSDRVCQNLEGSYSCVCRSGFKINGVTCEDIDECTDESLNDCPELTTLCRNTYGNYSCECRKGFQMKNDICEDINECEAGIDGCSHICNNIDGDYNCGCLYGFTLGNDRKSCEKVKDSCSLFPGLNCSYACRQFGRNPHTGICFCEAGYQLGSDKKTCIDIDECKENSPCDHTCRNVLGSFKCGCDIGYELQNDERSCKACNGFYGVNCTAPCKCGRGSSSCHHITGCVCQPGWTGETCETDIDECKNNPCNEHTICQNTPGSYQCVCEGGFSNKNGHCEDIDECQNPNLCEQNCINTEGSYKCGCKNGFKLINVRNCIDINECTEAKCHDCSNYPGGFKCSCNQGYKINSTTLTQCHNINECIEWSNPCSTDAICIDTIGSYNCKCPQGFKENGHICTDINECVDGSNQCSTHASCSNTIGNYTCSCHLGFRGNGRTCTDINECVDHSNQCSTDASCSNTIGSYNCSCHRGFKGNGRICTACSYFTYGEQCSEQCTCIADKTESCDTSSGNCYCKTGWEGNDCSKDIDECKKGTIKCDTELQVCINTLASAHCECRYGGININGCIHPKPPYDTNEVETKVKLEVKFATTTSRYEFLTNTMMLHEAFETSLEKYYKMENVSGFYQVKVLSIRFGSLIIDYEIIGNKTDSENFTSSLATSMTKLLNGERHFLVLQQTPAILHITIKDDYGSPIKHISASSSPCFVFGGFGASCPRGKQCDDSTGVANCVKISDKDAAALLIVLGITIPLCIIIVALVVLCICHHKQSNITKVIDIMETNMMMKTYKELACPSEEKKPVEKEFVRPAWVY